MFFLCDNNYVSGIRIYDIPNRKYEIILLDIPRINILPATNVEIIEGASQNFTCFSISSPANATWRTINGSSFLNNTVILPGGILSINSATGANAQTFTCLLENAAGVVSLTATLSVIGKLSIEHLISISLAILISQKNFIWLDFLSIII